MEPAGVGARLTEIGHQDSSPKGVSLAPTSDNSAVDLPAWERTPPPSPAVLDRAI